jgi:hypothetical protein
VNVYTVWNDLKKILPDKISESSIPERLPGSYRLVSINGQPAQGEMQITRNSDSEFSFESALSNNFGILQYQGTITQQRGRWYVHIQDSNDLNAIRRPVANHVTFEGNRLIFRTAEGVDFAFVWAKSVGFPK